MAFKIADGYVEVHAKADKNSARQAANDSVRESDRVGRNNEGSLLRWLFKSNPQIMQMLQSPIASALSSPIVLAGVVVLAGALAGAIGTAVSVAILGAVGVGLIGAGAWALRKNKQLKKEWETSTAEIEKVLTRAAQPMLQPLMDGINYFEKRFKALEPQLNRLFKAAGPLITPMIDMFVGLLEAMLPGIEKAMPGIQIVFDTLAKHMPGLGTAIGDFFATIAEQGPLLEASTGLLITWLEIFFKVLGPVLLELMGMFVLLADIWSATTTGVVAAGEWVVTTWKKIPGWWDKTWGAVSGWFSDMWGKITGGFTSAAATIDGWWEDAKLKVSNGANAVMGFLEAIPGRVAAVVMAIPGYLYQGFLNTFDNIMYSVGFAIGTIVKMIRDFPTAIATIFVNGWKLFREIWDKGWDNLFGGTEEAGEGIFEYIMNLVPRVMGWFNQLWVQAVAKTVAGKDQILSFIGQLPGAISNYFRAVAQNALAQFRNGVDWIIDTAYGLRNRLINALHGAGTWLKSVGWDLMKGLGNGIQDMLGWCVDMAWRAARKIKDGFMDALGIGSPSKVMAEEVGRWIPPGVTVGMEKSMPAMLDRINGLPDLITGQRSPLGATMAQPTSAPTGGGDMYVTITVSGLQELEDIKGFLDGKLKGSTKASQWAGNLYEAQGAYERDYR